VQGLCIFKDFLLYQQALLYKKYSETVIKLIQKGFCQSPPPGCPKAIYKLMVDCW